MNAGRWLAKGKHAKKTLKMKKIRSILILNDLTRKKISITDDQVDEISLRLEIKFTRNMRNEIKKSENNILGPNVPCHLLSEKSINTYDSKQYLL